MMVKAYVPIWLISWIVLFPVNSVGQTANLTGLDRFTFGNVAVTQQSRLWVHLILDYAFICTSTFCGIADESLDHLPDMARNAALARHSTTFSGLEVPLEIASS
jgi:hypothetical protein